MSTIVRKKISELKPHPRNEEIYGANESIADLKEKIRKSGLVTTLTITDDNVILSGNRRWKSCKQLVAEGDKRFCTVNCEIKSFDNEEDELEYLVICNNTREKTMEQKAREAQALIDVEKLRAKHRQSHKKVTETHTQYGRTREIVAKETDFSSGRTLERAIQVVGVIDRLTQQCRFSDAEIIRQVLNKKSVSTAQSLAVVIDDITEKEKQAIKNKTISAHKIANKYLDKRKTQNLENISPQEKEKLRHEQICKDVVDEYIERSLGLSDISDISVDEHLNDAITFINTSVITLNAALSNLLGKTQYLSNKQKRQVFSILSNVENIIKELEKSMEV